MLVYTTAFSERTFWRCERFVRDYDSVDPQDRVQVGLEEANLISSLLESGLHAPALDIDHPSTLRGRLLKVTLSSDEADVILGFPSEEIKRATDSLVTVGFAEWVDLSNSQESLIVSIQLAVPVCLVPSKTPDHYHLYAEMELDFEKYYEDILLSLQAISVLEHGFVHMAQLRGMTCLRKPEKLGQLRLTV